MLINPRVLIACVCQDSNDPILKLRRVYEYCRHPKLLESESETWLKDAEATVAAVCESFDADVADFLIQANKTYLPMAEDDLDFQIADLIDLGDTLWFRRKQISVVAKHFGISEDLLWASDVLVMDCPEPFMSLKPQIRNHPWKDAILEGRRRLRKVAAIAKRGLPH